MTGNSLTGNTLRLHSGRSACWPVPGQQEDFIAHETKSRWSAHQLLEELVKAGAAERSRRSLERRLRNSGIKSFKPMADFDLVPACGDRT